MIKQACLIYVVGLALALSAGNCTGTRIDDKLVAPIDSVHLKGDIMTNGRGVELYTGFIGDNIYRTTACAKPYERIPEKNRRRESALRSAVGLARAQIRDAFELSTIGPGGYMYGLTFEPELLPSYMTKVVNEGKVIAHSFDEADACCLVYQIEGHVTQNMSEYQKRELRLKNVFMTIRSGPH